MLDEGPYVILESTKQSGNNHISWYIAILNNPRALYLLTHQACDVQLIWTMIIVRMVQWVALDQIKKNISRNLSGFIWFMICRFSR